MAIQTFTIGQTLTAAQMTSLQQNDFNQTVTTVTASRTLIAGDVGTTIVMNSASSTTITVNTSLFSAGDQVKIRNIGSGVCTVTAGTATVSSAGPLAIPQYGSGTLFFVSAGVAIYEPTAVTAAASALTLITAVSFSAQTTVAFANSIFTSTYNRYLIQMSAKSSSDNSAVTMQLRDNSTTKSTAAYAGANQGGTYDGSSTTQGTNFQTSFKMGNTGTDYQNYYSFYVSRPTDATLYTVWSGTAFIRSNGVGNVIGAVLGGTYNVNEAHTGLVFTFASTSTGDYRVYGLADS